MPLVTARRAKTLAAAATLTRTRDSLRYLFAPEGVMPRVAEALVQAGVTHEIF